MKVTATLIVIGVLGTVTKDLILELKNSEIRGRVETIKTIAFWERPEYWEESWRFEDICCPLWKTTW